MKLGSSPKPACSGIVIPIMNVTKSIKLFQRDLKRLFGKKMGKHENSPEIAAAICGPSPSFSVSASLRRLRNNRFFAIDPMLVNRFCNDLVFSLFYVDMMTFTKQGSQWRNFSIFRMEAKLCTAKGRSWTKLKWTSQAHTAAFAYFHKLRGPSFWSRSTFRRILLTSFFRRSL